MSGIKYLLDTNFILGLLKSQAEILVEIQQLKLTAGQCAYSAVTRMELLGFTGISRDEETLIRHKLARLTYLPITTAVEDVAISLRQSRKIKLPDAVIAATALCAGLQLLTQDAHLKSVIASTGEI
ncbi:MAG: type II toxin-antitoxin system VapC family toxin [Rhodoferax sp.]|nr:type II toxin-antitoxin system VapC family toxin [Rhodoferax sp.]